MRGGRGTASQASSISHPASPACLPAHAHAPPCPRPHSTCAHTSARACSSCLSAWRGCASTRGRVRAAAAAAARLFPWRWPLPAQDTDQPHAFMRRHACHPMFAVRYE